MKHECFWDAAHACARLRIVGELTPAQAEVLMDQLAPTPMGSAGHIGATSSTACCTSGRISLAPAFAICGVL